MATMVGVIGAEIVTMGVIALPAMLSRGYDKQIALGSICAGGGLATLIPPSVVFILYGLTAGVSIGQLYMAGVIPGLLLAAILLSPTSSSAAGSRRSLRRLRRRRRSRSSAAREARPAGGADRSPASSR